MPQSRADIKSRQTHRQHPDISITLDLSPDTEARLMAEAAARGISVEELLKTTIDTLLATSESLSQTQSATPSDPEPEKPFHQTATTAEWVEVFKTWANSPVSDAPPLSDEAISRESIYREREDSQL